MLLLVLVGYVGVLVFIKVHRRLSARSAARQTAPAPAPAPEPTAPTTNPLAFSAGDLGSWWETADRVDATLRQARAVRDDPVRAAALYTRLQEDLEAAPDVMDLRAEQARLLQIQGRHEEACSVAFDLLKIDPWDPAIALLLARSLSELRRNEEALSVAQWILEQDALSAEAHRLAYRACLATGRPGQALRHIEQLLVADPDNATLLQQMAMAYSQSGEYAQGIAVLQKALKKDPFNPVVLFHLSSLYARSSKPEEAVDTLSLAAGELGYPFVATWLDSPELDPIRETDAFRKFCEVTTNLLSGSSTNPIAQRPTEADPSGGSVP